MNKPITTDKIVKAAQECGGTLKEPYDYGARPDSLIMSFDALEKFTQKILDAVNKERHYSNTIHTFGYNDKGDVVLRATRTSFDPSTDHRIAECALMFREAVVVRKQTNIDPFVLWEHIMGFKWEKPIDMVLHCPACKAQHIDRANHFADDEAPCDPPNSEMAPEDAEECDRLLREYEAKWTNPPHRSHLCHACGCIWRPADVPTNGVAAITTKGKADTWGTPIPDCGEAGHAEGACGNAQCLPSNNRIRGTT